MFSALGVVIDLPEGIHAQWNRPSVHSCKDMASEQKAAEREKVRKEAAEAWPGGDLWSDLLPVCTSLHRYVCPMFGRYQRSARIWVLATGRDMRTQGHQKTISMIWSVTHSQMH